MVDERGAEIERRAAALFMSARAEHIVRIRPVHWPTVQQAYEEWKKTPEPETFTPPAA